MNYRDDMNADELAALLAEVRELDAAYADQPDPLVPTTEEEIAELDAAEEQSLDYFNRYIAGDKK